ncbi:anthranilate synthase component I family protein [Paenibacillus sp. MSJ-34]|uniref:anthranilate synthase component I family protein n=1 Tax=Paenibacillus sp. MSJ-34 TaxID=2841529 RepID=UPI00345F7C64
MTVGTVLTSYDQWRKWAEQQYTVLPYVVKYKLDSPERLRSWNQAWHTAGDYAFVLESGKDGRYTFLGLRPEAVIRGKGDRAQADELSANAEGQSLTGKPLELVKGWMAPYRSPFVDGAPKFIGGCVGYLSYDTVRSLEELPERAADDLGLPDYLFMRINELWIIDHERAELYCAVHTPVLTTLADEEALPRLYQAALQSERRMKGQWDAIRSSADDERTAAEYDARLRMVQEDKLHMDIESLTGIETLFPKSDFEEAVRRIQQYIRQGDVFQVNLSLRQSRAIRSVPEELYEWLRLFNPSPYMGFLRCPDFQLVSASPELLVKLERGRVSTRPIAGTRRRGRTEREDREMAAELLASEKERAEHIMLVDLERNDLGRISKYGTVRVSELMAVEYYSHVMHLVSEVVGELAEGKDAYDVLAATFPGGTITGAPKIRTMEIIEELEPTRRGPYTGSLGFIDYNGNMEFNIIIRTLTVREGVGHIQAGAGIVIDSDPEREYYESMNKAKALWKAIQYSERELGDYRFKRSQKKSSGKMSSP